MNFGDDSDVTNIFEYIDKMISKIKSRFVNYKQIPKSGCFLEIFLNYGGNSNHMLSKDVPEKYSNHIILSYPVDFLIRSRNINRAPIINIYIPITYDMKFYVDVKTPHFVSISDFKINTEFYDLKTFNEVLPRFENYLIDYLKDIVVRETVIHKIIDANFGFPLEIDTLNYSKFSLYFHYNKNSMSLANSSFKGKGVSPVTPTPNPNSQLLCNNLMLFFSFIKEEKKLEFQIINCDVLRMIAKRKFDYSASEREINNLLSSILETILENISKKK
jgi:hypothetical protein